MKIRGRSMTKRSPAALAKWDREHKLPLDQAQLNRFMLPEAESRNINTSSKSRWLHMRIADIKSGDKRVNLEAPIVWVDEKGIQTYTAKDGSEGQRIRVGIRDDSGSTFITLFGEAASLKLKKGKTLRIENGYVKDYQGKPQLNVGKFGSVEVL